MNPEFESLILRLDECVPRDGAWVQFAQRGGGPDESKAVGSRTGYQRLGIEFLKAALRDGPTQPFEVDLGYLVSEESDIAFNWFELADGPEGIQPTSTWLDRLLPFGCLIPAMTAAMMIIIGVGTTIRWITT